MRASRAHPPEEPDLTTLSCANCGTPHEADALFCARCGRDFTQEFKGTPMTDLVEASPVLRRLREAFGDRYVIERELGKGGMATVFLARDVKHDREVAIKVLDPDISASVGAERFEREIRVAAKLQHPNILGLFDSGTADGLVYYVMPFVKGESLRDRITREGMLPIDDAVRIALQVASALGAAHEAGIIHRDIKPENIMLSGEHTLVADFGIARAASEAGAEKLTQTGITVGTPVYMAPEQATGDPVGPPSDIYSLGCVLYEMLAGEPPFTGPNLMAIASKHLMEVVPSVRVTRPAVPEEIEQAIFITLNKQAIDRPQNAAQFAELLGGMATTSGAMMAMRASTAMRRSTMMRGSSMMPRMTTGPHGVPVFYEEAPLPAPLWKRAVPWVGGGIVVAASAAAITWATGRGGPDVRDNANRVAVTYFADLSPDSSLRSVATGLTEGLIRSLARIKELDVISRGGVEPFRDSTFGADSVARALRAGYAVRGDLAPEGTRIRVSIALLDARNGATVKSGGFPVSRDSLGLAQDSISSFAASLISQQLQTELSLERQRAQASSNAAWLAVQEGARLQREGLAQLAQAAAQSRDTAQRRQAAKLDSTARRTLAGADSVLAVATKLDGKWIEPRTRRSQLAYALSRAQGRDPAVIRPLVERAIAHADSALAIDAEDPDALEARGTARYWGVLSGIYVEESRNKRDMESAQGDLEKAVMLNARQATAHATLSHMYTRIPTKTTDDVYAEAKRALDADEFQANVVVIRARLFTASFDLGRFADAAQYCGELERRYPGDVRAIRCRLLLQAVPTDPTASPDRAWRLADSLASGRDTLALLTGHIWVAAALARASVNAPAGSAQARMLADSARAVAERSEGNAQIDAPRDLALFAAYTSAILGDKPTAFRRLQAYFAANPQQRDAYRQDPTWAFRRWEQDPDWQRLVAPAR